MVGVPQSPKPTVVAFEPVIRREYINRGMVDRHDLSDECTRYETGHSETTRQRVGTSEDCTYSHNYHDRTSNDICINIGTNDDHEQTDHVDAYVPILVIDQQPTVVPFLRR